MSHRLVCASCAGPVSEGRCPVCRRSRAELRDHDHQNWVSIALIALIAAVVAVLLVTAAHVTA